GDKVEADEKKRIESAIEELKKVLQGEDKDAIEARTKSLTELSGKLAERVYAQQAESAAADSGSGAGSSESRKGDASGSKDDVVDAEFEEVKEDKK
ncbi:MAG: Hsp70 family protein, partial [Methylococcaceae bacterium]|nr:Hsp70 family protein [Methylococcaceae bacterium]